MGGGLKNNRTREIRLEIVTERTSDTMKKIINFFVAKGNIIVTDRASCYNWLNDPIHNYDIPCIIYDTEISAILWFHKSYRAIVESS